MFTVTRIAICAALWTVLVSGAALDPGFTRPSVNYQPIIGVLAQENPWFRPESRSGVSLIGASYVKFIEAGGARVIPIFVNRTREYYEDILCQINGVLLPGGAASLDASMKGYGTAADHIWEIAKKFNDEGDFFPLWGTCLGFEMLAYQDANNSRDVLRSCFAMNVAYPLSFTNTTGRLYEKMSPELKHATATENLTFNIHINCITNDTLKASGIDKNWRVLSTNVDHFGIEFVSSYEHVSYPFYGTQFHPEKNPFEWGAMWRVPHSENAIALSQYYARFFVNEARRSQHRFFSPLDESRHLIYNFQPSFTGRAWSDMMPFIRKYQFEQAYLFSPETDYPPPESKQFKDILSW